MRSPKKASDHILDGLRMAVSPNRVSSTNDAGQALVELALVLPLFVLLLAGAAEIGRIAYAAIEVSNAARAAVAYAAQTHGTAAPSNYAAIQQAALAEAPDVPGLQVQPQTLSCSCQDSTTGSATSIACSSTALTSCPSPSVILEDVTVNTSANFDPGFHIAGLPSTFNLQGTATMRVEQ